MCRDEPQPLQSASARAQKKATLCCDITVIDTPPLAKFAQQSDASIIIGVLKHRLCQYPETYAPCPSKTLQQT
jgi:hypothetical protein